LGFDGGLEVSVCADPQFFHLTGEVLEEPLVFDAQLSMQAVDLVDFGFEFET
jgi:hypothetical protein